MDYDRSGSIGSGPHAGEPSDSLLEYSGECHVCPTDGQFYPCLIPHFNGRTLNVKPELLHSALAGISVKHEDGKCYRSGERMSASEGFLVDSAYSEYNGCEEFYELELSESGKHCNSSKSSWKTRESSDVVVPAEVPEIPDYLPECMREKINHRNSFWNLHRPELCKLKWSQNYVSTATVVDFLHDHLTSHGDVCADFHREEDRAEMLNKELDEYGRLKMLAAPRKIPPDEPPFELKEVKSAAAKSRCKTETVHSKCRGFPRRKMLATEESRFLQLNDDEDEIPEGKSLRRSKEEFCLTIGRPTLKTPLKISISETEEVYGGREAEYYPGEEECGFFFFNWLGYGAEECYDEEEDTGDFYAHSDGSTMEADLEAPGTMVEPCPVLGMSDFCRAVAKADFSDLRCHPDDF